MFLPRYSIRTVFYLAVLVAAIAVVAGQATRGAEWAIAVIVAVTSVMLSWAVYVLFYGIAAGFARVALTSELRGAQPAYYPELRTGSAPSSPSLPIATSDTSD